MLGTSRRAVLQRISIMVLLGLAALLGIKWVQLREPLLTRRARPVQKVDIQRQFVSWLSDHELLITTGPPISFVQQPRAADEAAQRLSVDLLDLKTHTSTHLGPLTDLVNRSPEFHGFQLSPDRSWLLWGDEEFWIHNSIWTKSAHLDGTCYRKWSEPGPSIARRLFLDSRRLALTFSFADKYILLIRDLQNPAQDRLLNTAQQVESAIAPYAALHPWLIDVVRDGTVGSGSMHVVGVPILATSPLNAQTLCLSTPNPTRTRILNLPPSAHLEEVAVSPQQKYILYHLHTSQSSPSLAWLHRFIPQIPVTPTVTDALWVSRSDGSGLHEIGHEPYTGLSSISPNDRLESIQWLPDGKRISFTYEGMLYVLSVEP